MGEGREEAGADLVQDTFEGRGPEGNLQRGQRRGERGRAKIDFFWEVRGGRREGSDLKVAKACCSFVVLLFVFNLSLFVFCFSLFIFILLLCSPSLFFSFVLLLCSSPLFFPCFS